MNNYGKFILLFLLTFFTVNSNAQDTTSNDHLNIFLDCNFCDRQYLRQNLGEVNFVRDRMVADVHLLFTRQNTGSNGKSTHIQFIGLNEFEHIADTVSYTTDFNMSSDEIRQRQLKYIQLGLVPYWLKNGQAESITLDVPRDHSVIEETEDEWRNWVFNMGVNGWFNGQELRRSASVNGNLSARQVKENNKFGIWMGMNNSLSTFIFEDTVYKNRQQSFWSNIENVFTINNHWSYGLFGSFGNSIFSNYDFYGEVSNGIEYNFFDYEEAYSKQLIINYQIGARYNDYIDTTVFNKTEELVPYHRMIFGGTSRQQWGNLGGTITYNSFLHDLNLYSVRFGANMNVRLVKGLTMRFNGSFSLIRNQLNIEKQGVSVEELLLQQQQLGTGYSYWFNAGINYAFGSIYNTIVNPRFDI